MLASSVLVVDDDPGCASYLALALKQTVGSVRIASNAIEAMLSMERDLPDLVITDLQMPGVDGLELLRRVKERWPGIPVVLTTVDQDVATVVEAIQRGAVNYLVKPVAPAVVQAAVTRALAHVARTPGTASAGNALEIVGVGAAAVQLRHMVFLAARSDVNVVIVGETGTGKELVSRAIHRLSALAHGPFVAHNCARTPPDMFDSEFFGHRRGAFTGADRDRAGLLRQAHGGVLFLDELECLSLANQAKLLRVLDDGEVRPVGSEQARQISVRFLAATNQIPKSMLLSKQLRDDLYYRLRGFEIQLPPLRERREDIVELSVHFLSSRRATLTAAALTALERCSWPGNVRQLRNVLHAAASVVQHGLVDIDDLDLSACGVPDESLAPQREIPVPDVVPVQQRLEQTKQAAILRAVELHGGSVSRAADALGIHRSTLRRKLAALGIRHPGKR